MDPDANFAEQVRLLNAETPADKARRRELRLALAEWLARGGFSPDFGASPETWRAFKKWRRDMAKFSDLSR